jgi:Uma2 family endonuclease
MAPSSGPFLDPRWSTVNAMSLATRLDLEPVSYEEFLGLPEDEGRVEFVDGIRLVSPGATGPHAVAVARLNRRLAQSLPAGYEVLSAPLDWVLSREPLLVRQPDIVVVTLEQARLPRLSEPPLLAVEVLSPGSVEQDLVHKRREYADAGLPWYWLVSLAPAQVVVLRNAGDSFAAHASAAGEERLAVTSPFPVEVRPVDLVP